MTYRGKALCPGSDAPDLVLASRLPHAVSPASTLGDPVGDWT
jgi:hypothetical protein